MEQKTKVYGRTGIFLGALENAKVGYTLKETPLSTAKATLPADDAANALLAPLNLVEVYDGGERIDLFRVIGMPEAALKAQRGTASYKLEHVLATLLDDLLPGYHEIGGTGARMRDCIAYILARQSVPRWRLGRCDFDTYFQYSFTNEYLLKALLALPKQLAEPYLWTTDTATTPWTLNLVRPDPNVGCELRYQQNMLEIKKSYDGAPLCTRVYPYGYGEGVNQLTIRDVNGGLPYLDADTQNEWGLIVKPFVDSAMEQPQALYNRAKAWLEQQKNPRYSYTIKGVDAYRLTGEPWYRFRPGKLCRVNDQEHGVLVEARVTQVNKNDVLGKPGEMEITISNAAANVANEIADLAARASVNELYAQGATNFYAEHFADNAAPDKPCRFRFPVDSDCVRINKVRLKYDLEPFRAYSKGVEAGGGSERTSRAGGAATVSAESQVLSRGFTTGTPLAGEGVSAIYTEANEAGLDTGRAGGHTHPMGHHHNGSSHSHSFSGSDGLAHYHYRGGDTYTGGVYGGLTASISGSTGISGGGTTSTGTRENTDAGGEHSHSVQSHTHRFIHHHKVTVGFTIPGQRISIPAHTHTVELPSHTHGIEYGIFEGGTASAVSLKVDGNAVPASAVTGGELDLAPYLSKDARGKILRGAWHEVEITPNDITRIVADIYVKTFIRSQGGGDY